MPDTVYLKSQHFTLFHLSIDILFNLLLTLCIDKYCISHSLTCQTPITVDRLRKFTHETMGSTQPLLLPWIFSLFLSKNKVEPPLLSGEADEDTAEQPEWIVCFLKCSAGA